MSPCRAIPLALLAAALMAAEPAPGGDLHRSPNRLDMAMSLQKEGRLVAAAQAYRAIVEQGRFDLPCSLPALLQWSACCQGRSSDPALAAEWEQQAPRLLEKLDGPVDARMARESLLWKSWTDQPAIILMPKGAVMSSRPNGREVRACWIASLALAQGKGYELPARSDVLAELLPAQATLEDGATLVSDPYCIGISEHASWIGNLSFPVPDRATAERIVRVSGTLRITQASSCDVVVLPLKAQASAELPGVGRVTILSAKPDKSGYQVVCSPPIGAEAKPRLEERIAEGHRRGQWMSEELILEQWNAVSNMASYWLQDAQGRRIHPNLIVGFPPSEPRLSFPAAGLDPATTSLVVCRRTAPSSREFTFAFTRAELKQPTRR